MKSKRIYEMEHYIHLHKKVSLSELEEKFQISINTVRRDIKELLKKEVIKKVYGGVESIKDGIIQTEDVLIDIEKRHHTKPKEKQNIAKKAATFIRDGDTIYIDSGTTTLGILDYLSQDIKITVVTNSLPVINKAVKFPNVDIILSGNKYLKRTSSFTKLGTYSILERLNVSKAFMAATSVSIDNGVMNATMEEYELKTKVVSKTKEKYLLVDCSKFNKLGFITFAELTEFKTIITDSLDDELMKQFAQLKNITFIETAKEEV
ncbi:MULTISPECIES: DeoR/GlpR family DNA-binding transcription regulator [unclassified Gemella]|uniref:DeoR/GlpR family DNA-binding transcription regulator n=1 Tax=unclassified Gemella TaxID=2624949 RepID=UPI001C047683|nr:MULTISPECIES: DeoR/GlpR family DNA-binding transcription regulator [unclassified Gemella]MBU0278243.1 DeoR/GlpR family DNA-binding transcription regulator [Gemella sp. zg-1178]QWQ38802.1 DeoR/GlpR family DNA-binding transcription regulator [Gemella sp. zg-570]